MPLPAMAQGLRVFQWGKEATRGTAVPATSKVAAIDLDFEPTDLLYRPELARGVLIGNRGYETVIERGTKFVIAESPLSYEQLPNWCSMSLKGGVTPTGVGPYVYIYNRPLTADPNPDAWTLERRLSDGTNFIDEQFAYALLEKLTIKGGDGQPLMFGGNGFARRVKTNALTAALTMPTPEIPPAALVTVYMDSTWANLGVTQITSQVYGFDFAFDTGIVPFMTMDGRTDLDFTTHLIDPKKIKITMKLLALVANSGVFATEKTAAEAANTRAMRIQVAGTSGRQIQIDMLLKHKLGSVFKVGNLNGQDMIQLDLEETNDGANFLQIKVTNNVAAGPL